MQKHQEDGRVLAGGQSLIPLLALRLARPALLIDLARIAELARLGEWEGGISIGAMVRQRVAERSPLVRQRAPLLAAALKFIAHPAIRSRGTVGGSLAHADPAAELPAVVVTLEAELVVASSERGERTIPAADFFSGHYTTALLADEILTEIRIPGPGPSTGFSFHEVSRRSGDFAMVGVAAAVAVEEGSISGARLCLTGVADRPVLATAPELGLLGVAPDRGVFEAAGEAIAARLRPPTDLHGSAEYRRQLALVLVARALRSASQRARGDNEDRREGAPA